MASPETYMRLCLELAQRAAGRTAPNPMVGAVLVHGDRIIGQGWHHFYGADHAEVNCLNNVTDADRQLIPESTMYVNLEPCAHYGKTPPCAQRLVTERVKKVVIANTDPFEKVSGKGIKILQDAGIEVVTGIMEKEGLWLNRRFFCFQKQKRPYIILKWAQTADGFIAPADKGRMQISSDQSIQLVHEWRTEEAAIMVGTNTAVNDNPRLTARLAEGNQPLRIALDKSLQIPNSHNLYNEEAPTWIINEQRETLEGNIRFIQLPFDNTPLPGLLYRLYDAKMLSLIVEGGTALLNSFIDAGLWDEARIFTSMSMLHDGVKAPALPGGQPSTTMDSGDDKLELFINAQSEYAFIPGMKL